MRASIRLIFSTCFQASHFMYHSIQCIRSVLPAFVHLVFLPECSLVCRDQLFRPTPVPKQNLTQPRLKLFQTGLHPWANSVVEVLAAYALVQSDSCRCQLGLVMLFIKLGTRCHASQVWSSRISAWPCLLLDIVLRLCPPWRPRPSPVVVLFVSAEFPTRTSFKVAEGHIRRPRRP